MGGKGGPLAFLNKKPWHPGNLRNLERVWQKEQEHEREQKRLEELRKQILEERQKEELEQIAHDSGKYKREERLEWLYQGGVAARQEADERNQQQALKDEQNQKTQQQAQVIAKVQEASLLPSFYSQDTPASALETWQRLNNDPLFLIKKKEQEALQKIKKNPVTMMRLKEQVQAQESPEKSHKKSKKSKKSKKQQKEKSKKRKRSPSMSTQDEDEDEYLEKIAKKARQIEENQSPQNQCMVQQQEDPEKQHQRRHGYGLSEGVNPDYSRHKDTTEQSKQTRQMLQQAAKDHQKQQQEERQRYQQRYNKQQQQQYKTGRLNQEEIDKKRKKMMENASYVDKDRQRTVKNEDREQIVKEQNNNQRNFNQSKFIQQTQKEFYGSDRKQQGDSLSDRVARRRYYSQRNYSELE